MSGGKVGLYKLIVQLAHSLKGTWFQTLNLSSETLVPKFAFKFNLYRYSKAIRLGLPTMWEAQGGGGGAPGLGGGPCTQIESGFDP
jgi:hypothetical protein